MKNKNFQLMHIRIDKEMHEKIVNIAEQRGESQSEIIRFLLKKGLSMELAQENQDYIVNIIRRELDNIIKPHIERLAKLSAKSGHMSATAAFLNVQTLQSLVPNENKRDVIELYSKARKKAVEYMKTPMKTPTK